LWETAGDFTRSAANLLRISAVLEVGVQV